MLKTAQFTIHLAKYDRRAWAGKIDDLRRQLGAPNNKTLFPPHFLKVVFPKIGGKVVEVRTEKELLGVGFLFPRGIIQAGIRCYTLRYHPVPHTANPDPELVVAKVERMLDGDRVVFYDPNQHQGYARIPGMIAQVEISRPDISGAQNARELQREVWGAEPDFLYPADLYSNKFYAGTALVARFREDLAGFLFGFYKFGGSRLPSVWSDWSDLRLESQLMGVLPKFRGHGLGFQLKRLQAQEAIKQGIGIINWTVDPLQYANARLNFGKLGAVAYTLYPGYYPFHNDLNQVPASRFEVVWPVFTSRVARCLNEPKTEVVDLKTKKARRVNPLVETTYLFDEAVIAIEIPADWTRMQREQPEKAAVWRQQTDQLFQLILGCEKGKYTVTGVGEDGDRRFLIAELFATELI